MYFSLITVISRLTIRELNSTQLNITHSLYPFTKRWFGAELASDRKHWVWQSGRHSQKVPSFAPVPSGGYYLPSAHLSPPPFPSFSPHTSQTGLPWASLSFHFTTIYRVSAKCHRAGPWTCKSEQNKQSTCQMWNHMETETVIRWSHKDYMWIMAKAKIACENVPCRAPSSLLGQGNFPEEFKSMLRTEGWAGGIIWG